MKTLVWITHSFRLDSRLTDSLEGECTFVYYSPYYFAGKRKQSILRRTSQSNLDAFYLSLHQFNQQLQDKGSYLYVYKRKDPIEHLNQLCIDGGYDRVIIDQPQFAMFRVGSLKIQQLRGQPFYPQEPETLQIQKWRFSAMSGSCPDRPCIHRCQTLRFWAKIKPDALRLINLNYGIFCSAHTNRYAHQAVLSP